MRLLIVSATTFEIDPLRKKLQQSASALGQDQFQDGPLTIQLLTTGVGLTATAYALTRTLCHSSPGLVINAGVAGSFQPDWELGKVVQVVSETFGDLGVEEADGRFTDLFGLELISRHSPPFQNARLWNPAGQDAEFLPKAHGLSVNTVHGYGPSIEKIRQQYDVDIESMEGAAFFYVCLQERVPFLEIRSISNLVEPRNRESWNIPLAIGQLNAVLEEMLNILKR